MSGHNLNADLAKAIGLPPNTTRAVLTLEAGELPLLEVTCHATDDLGRLQLETDPDEPSGLAQRIKSVHFKLRLEPFETA